METKTTTEPISMALEKLRMDMVELRSKFDDLSHKHPGWKERFQPFSGLLTCGISASHHIVEELKQHEIRCADALEGPSIVFRPRGMGLDICPGCFVCDAKVRAEGANDYMNNIAAFVASKEDGEKVIGWFDTAGGGARLDFRPSEPSWIQVKIGACDLHRPNLEYLLQHTGVYGRIRYMHIINAKAFKAPPEPVLA